MKQERQRALINIINSQPVGTQEDLLNLLSERGFQATQATISRDFRELRIGKVRKGKEHRYVQLAPEEERENDSYSHMLSTSIRSMEHAENLIVIKTDPGMAMAVGAGIDALNIAGVMGCIAGDDTLFLAISKKSLAEKIMGEIRNAG